MKKLFLSKRFLMIYAGASTLLLLSILFSFLPPKEIEKELTVQRLNIVDENGKNVLVLSNKSLIPDPVLGGKTFKRAVDAGGIILYKESGDETGGIAMSETDETGLRAMVLDYNNTDAIGLVVREDHDKTGDYSAGLMINDRGDPEKPGDGKNRIILENSNGVARLVIKDGNGKSRISLGVDAEGELFFDLFDSNEEKIKSLVQE